MQLHLNPTFGAERSHDSFHSAVPIPHAYLDQLPSDLESGGAWKGVKLEPGLLEKVRFVSLFQLLYLYLYLYFLLGIGSLMCVHL